MPSSSVGGSAVGRGGHAADERLVRQSSELPERPVRSVQRRGVGPSVGPSVGCEHLLGRHPALELGFRVQAPRPSIRRVETAELLGSRLAHGKSRILHKEEAKQVQHDGLADGDGLPDRRPVVRKQVPSKTRKVRQVPVADPRPTVEPLPRVAMAMRRREVLPQPSGRTFLPRALAAVEHRQGFVRKKGRQAIVQSTNHVEHQVFGERVTAPQGGERKKGNVRAEERGLALVGQGGEPRAKPSGARQPLVAKDVEVVLPIVVAGMAGQVCAVPHDGRAECSLPRLSRGSWGRVHRPLQTAHIDNRFRQKAQVVRLLHHSFRRR
ncbi:hypothetical protein DFJ74DRAFT_237738 [Hyaloraphidium curvatum]|nr:hypothetical protein DFJ74DRAFT_237738 [Hyaloraphidium curvatum]